jgi:hypothetical protein
MIANAIEGEIEMEVRLTFCDEVDTERYEICSGKPRI